MLALGLAACVSVSAMEPDNTVSLPKPDTDGTVTVESAIRERRSARDYSGEPLTLAELGQLLWAAQGLTSRDGLRSAPSAGALYPLEVYVVAGKVESLAAGVYRYLPRGHRLRHVADGDLRESLAAAALNQSWVRRAPAVLVIAGVYERSAEKYGARAPRYTHIEVGHVAQNVYLQAVARDLGTVIVGAFRESEVQELLQLPANHVPLALMPVGHPR